MASDPVSRLLTILPKLFPATRPVIGARDPKGWMCKQFGHKRAFYYDTLMFPLCKNPSRQLPLLPVLVALLAALACSETMAPPVPAKLLSESPLSLAAIAGRAVAPSPSVRVRDQFGNPMVGVAVTFAASSGGVADPSIVPTDSFGLATVGAWTLATTVGANTLTASVANLPTVTFTALGTAGPSASIAKAFGDNQTAIAGGNVPTPPAVIVRDAHGNPVPGVVIVFSTTEFKSTVTGAEQMTNAEGIAAVGEWKLSDRRGAQTLKASAGNLSVNFSAAAVFGPPALFAIIGGNNQTTRAGFNVNRHLEVQISDVNLNRLGDLPVLFEPVGTGGSVVNGAQTTHAGGVATLTQWKLNTVGTHTLRATTPGLPPVLFIATATGPVPDGPAFAIDDPAGDVLPGRTQPPVYDVLAARGEFRSDTLVVRLTFSIDVVPPTAACPSCPFESGLDATVLLDVEGNNPRTGFGPDGAEFAVRTVERNSTSARLLAHGLDMLIPASYDGKSFTVRIPMALISGNDGNLRLAGRVFTWGPANPLPSGGSDFFPDSGSIEVRRPPG